MRIPVRILHGMTAALLCSAAAWQNNGPDSLRWIAMA